MSGGITLSGGAAGGGLSPMASGGEVTQQLPWEAMVSCAALRCACCARFRLSSSFLSTHAQYTHTYALLAAAAAAGHSVLSGAPRRGGGGGGHPAQGPLALPPPPAALPLSRGWPSAQQPALSSAGGSSGGPCRGRGAPCRGGSHRAGGSGAARPARVLQDPPQSGLAARASSTTATARGGGRSRAGSGSHSRQGALACSQAPGGRSCGRRQGPHPAAGAAGTAAWRGGRGQGESGRQEEGWDGGFGGTGAQAKAGKAREGAHPACCGHACLRSRCASGTAHLCPP